MSSAQPRTAPTSKSWHRTIFGVHARDFVIWPAAIRFSSSWGTFPFRPRNAIWDANRSCGVPLTISSGSSPILRCELFFHGRIRRKIPFATTQEQSHRWRCQVASGASFAHRSEGRVRSGLEPNLELSVDIATLRMAEIRRARQRGGVRVIGTVPREDRISPGPDGAGISARRVARVQTWERGWHPSHRCHRCRDSALRRSHPRLRFWADRTREHCVDRHGIGAAIESGVTT
jgi:hypothetical protein